MKQQSHHNLSKAPTKLREECYSDLNRKLIMSCHLKTYYSYLNTTRDISSDNIFLEDIIKIISILNHASKLFLLHLTSNFRY